MTRSPNRASRGGSRRSSKRPGRALLPTLMLLGGIALLFAMAAGANRVESLGIRQSQLHRDLAFQQDEYRRLLANYLTATSRAKIVPRAEQELGMIEPRPEAKSVMALPAHERPDEAPAFWRHLAKGFDRYGQIPAAAAQEDRP